MPKPLPLINPQNNAEPVILVNASGVPYTAGASANPATTYTAQKSATTSASALTAQALSNGIVITNDPDSLINVFVGPTGVTTSTGYKLKPGMSISFGVSDASAVFVITPTSISTVYIAGN